MFKNKVLHPGKTAHDHESGAWGRRLVNAATRAAWHRAAGAKGAKAPPFPVDVCNGRKTRALRAANKRQRKSKATGIQSRGGK